MKLSKVDCKFGAPMGRRSDIEVYGKVRLERVRLNQGGYDSGGAYWGSGEPLFRAEDSEGNQYFLRGKNRAAAKKFLSDMFEVTFYR